MTAYYPGGCWADNDGGRRAADGTTEACGAVAVCDLLPCAHHRAEMAAVQEPSEATRTGL